MNLIWIGLIGGGNPGWILAWLYFKSHGLIRTRSEFYYTNPGRGRCCLSSHYPAVTTRRSAIRGPGHSVKLVE